MNILKNYRRSLVFYSALLPFLVWHSTIVGTEIFQEPPRVVVHAKNVPFNPFYLSALSYDGANTLGCYWPQLLSGSRSNALWVDLGLLYTPSAGVGYRQLLKSSLFNRLCFWGVYGYLELPNWVLNPYGITFFKLNGIEAKTTSLLWDALCYVRGNIGAELGTPYVKVTVNGYAFPRKYAPLKDDLDIQQESYGYSLRLSYLSTLIEPFVSVSRSYLERNSSDYHGTEHSKISRNQWLVTYSIGGRYQLTDKLSVEIKYISDHDTLKQLPVKDYSVSYHLPLHIGFYYNPNSAVYRSKGLPMGYTTLPERFIPHYQNAAIRECIVNHLNKTSVEEKLQADKLPESFPESPEDPLEALEALFGNKNA